MAENETRGERSEDCVESEERKMVDGSPYNVLNRVLYLLLK